MGEEWWSDYSDFSLGGGDTLDQGSWAPGDYSGFSLGVSGLDGSMPPTGDPFSMPGLSAPTLPSAAGQLQDPAAGFVGFGSGGTQGGFAGGTPLAPTPTQPGNNIFGMSPNVLAALLGTGGSLAAILGTVAGGGAKSKTSETTQQTRQTTPGPEQTAIGQQAQQATSGLQTAAQGQLPLQQLQAQMLSAIAQGQVPPGLAQLVASAYDPAYQDVVRRAREASQRQGFHDAPLSAPPGGAIAGPAFAQLQGQQANSLLGLLQSLPQLYNQPVSNQINAQGNMAQGFGNLFSQYMPTAAQQTSGTGTGTQGVPLGPALGQAIGSGLQGLGQTIAQNQQQTQLNQLLEQMRQGQGGINLSGTRPNG